jgi:ubiquitin-activating enzyme E1 C
MDVDDNPADSFPHLRKILERKSPLHNVDYEPDPAILNFLRNDCRILLVGAGGLGCELVKNIALLGFGHIDIIDMDTIDLSNLNRQFLFRHKDIGRAKAEVAAEFISNRIAGVTVTPHCKRIQEYGPDFYSQFHLIICGLDSIDARRYMCNLLVSMLDHDEDGAVKPETIVPLVDGGTEGLKGNARVILSGMNACINCTIDLYPPVVNFPLCTIAHTPRLPEHCVEFVKILLWPKEQPFGEKPVDGDDPAHVSWIYEKAQQRAKEHNIDGVTYRLTQGVIKRIIPAVASTNAVIAAVCATEAFKLATTCFTSLNNYMIFSDVDGVYTYAYEAEKKEDCLTCSNVPIHVKVKPDDKLHDVRDQLMDEFHLKDPGLSTVVPETGKNRTLFMSKPEMMMEKTKPHLKMSLKELDLRNGQSIFVTDETSPVSFTFILSFQQE